MENRLFCCEILRQIELVSIAFENLKLDLSNSGIDIVWYHVQSFLVSTANISKILYSSPSSKQASNDRSKRLRDYIGLSDESCLANTKIRNCFEHYDEKLDRFVKDVENNHGNYIDSNIGNINSIYIEGVSTESYMRHFDPSTMVIIFRGIEFEMIPIANELKIIYEKIMQQ